MFWVFLGAAGFAAALYQLGAMSVWLDILSGGLRVATVGALAFLCYLAWRRWRSN